MVKPRMNDHFRSDHQQAENCEYYLQSPAADLFGSQGLQSPGCGGIPAHSLLIPSQEQDHGRADAAEREKGDPKRVSMEAMRWAGSCRRNKRSQSNQDAHAAQGDGSDADAFGESQRERGPAQDAHSDSSREFAFRRWLGG